MITDIKRKIKKIGSVLKMKKVYLENEVQIMNGLRSKKEELMVRMDQRKRDYFDGVEKLNVIRNSLFREGLDVYEQGVSKVKEDWINLHRFSQAMDKQIKQQGSLVIQIKNQIDGVEKIIKKYQLELVQCLDKKEQEAIDERASIDFSDHQRDQLR
ncbi:MAG: hypothetical protein KA436_07505 [Oligoflexales bacterium]|nr:hypothetical protein [Oligoflexales bacterium]